MLITNCLAYEDIKVKLSPVNDSFNLSIDANKVEISLTLNYLQLKTLGDSLISMANAANASELDNAIGKDFVGDIKVYYQQELEQKTTEINLENITEDIAKNNKNKESEEICLQQDLSALTTKQQLSKTA
jgi:hypothetical protein